MPDVGVVVGRTRSTGPNTPREDESMDMTTRIRPSLAIVLALVALGAALSNGAHAVATAQKNSVVSKSIKNGQVKTRDLARKAVAAANLKDGAVQTDHLVDGAVVSQKLSDSSVTPAKIAAGAVRAEALDQGSVGGEALGAVGIVSSTSAPISDVDGTANGGAHGLAESSVTCPPSSQMLSGGALWVNPSVAGAIDQNVYLQATHPYGNGWRARGLVDFGAQGTVQLRTYAVCLMPSVSP